MPQKKIAPKTTPSVALATEQQQEDFCEAILDHDGVNAACRAYGLKPAAVFYWANEHPEFRKRINAAQAANKEKQLEKMDAMCDELHAMSPDDRMKSANAYSKIFEYRMRILGKLNQMYGDKPSNQTLIQNNVGVVVDEQTRQRLIALHEQISMTDREARQLTDLPQEAQDREGTKP